MDIMRIEPITNEEFFKIKLIQGRTPTAVLDIETMLENCKLVKRRDQKFLIWEKLQVTNQEDFEYRDNFNIHYYITAFCILKINNYNIIEVVTEEIAEVFNEHREKVFLEINQEKYEVNFITQLLYKGTKLLQVNRLQHLHTIPSLKKAMKEAYKDYPEVVNEIEELHDVQNEEDTSIYYNYTKTS